MQLIHAVRLIRCRCPKVQCRPDKKTRRNSAQLLQSQSALMSAISTNPSQCRCLLNASTRARRSPPVQCQQAQNEPGMSRRGLLASGLLAAVALPSKAQAAGLELPQLPKLQPPDPTKTGGAANRKKLADAEDTFQNSDLLKRMKVRRALMHALHQSLCKALIVAVCRSAHRPTQDRIVLSSRCVPFFCSSLRLHTAVMPVHCHM